MLPDTSSLLQPTGYIDIRYQVRYTFLISLPEATIKKTQLRGTYVRKDPDYGR
jgi:hypothetical protein